MYVCMIQRVCQLNVISQKCIDIIYDIIYEIDFPYHMILHMLGKIYDIKYEIDFPYPMILHMLGYHRFCLWYHRPYHSYDIIDMILLMISQTKLWYHRQTVISQQRKVPDLWITYSLQSLSMDHDYIWIVQITGIDCIDWQYLHASSCGTVVLLKCQYTATSHDMIQVI